jgi:hypothetical protein
MNLYIILNIKISYKVVIDDLIFQLNHFSNTKKVNSIVIIIFL